mmetsp:Transcript_40310/g.61510  ORF Transcript_40310/g.61510 Transcript_40310/m.61510 type:complete len:139 (-) Transcript_40310:72-488(-)
MVEYIVIEEVYRKPEKEKADLYISGNLYNCYAKANVSFIVNIASMAVNFAWYSYLQNVEYATDVTWAKFSTILAFNILFQLIGAVFAGFLVITEQIDKFEECFEEMKALYIRQYFYTIGNFIVIVFQVTSLLRMTLEY